MKKIFVLMMMASLSLTCLPVRANATPTAKTTVTTTATECAAANALIARLNVIKSMDKSNLTAPEKKVLRKEVRSIKQQLSDISGGVYISVGAILLILILLIILL